MKRDLISAFHVLFGEWVDIYKIEIPYTKTPECILIEKEWLKGLSKEGRELVNIILSCPEECFFSNGRIMGGKIKDLCKKEKDWERNKVKEVIKEVARFVRI